jgi:hypothetical protein
MRELVQDYIRGLSLGSFTLVNDLPYDDAGIPLYIKNVKRIYVEPLQVETTPVIQTLGGFSLSNETNIIRVYFTADAKQVPANYDALVSLLKAAKDITTIVGAYTRECDVTTEFVSDLVVTTLELRYVQLT